jgi:dolichol-phosphate mannosyltransferase
MIAFALSGLVSFSIMPLRLATILGFGMAVTSFIIGLKAVIEYLITKNTVPGWVSTIVTVVLVGGVQLIILGIIGEYLGKLVNESKRRPHYIVRDSSEHAVAGKKSKEVDG